MIKFFLETPIRFIISYLREKSIINFKQGEPSKDKENCKPPGNAQCNPATWQGYSNNCCSAEEPCGEMEGDCNGDSSCMGSLVCEANSCPTSKGFHPRASCCQQPSGLLILGDTIENINTSIIIVFLLMIERFKIGNIYPFRLWF